MVTVPFCVGGGQRIVGGALGIQEHQSYCTRQESTLESYSGWLPFRNIAQKILSLGPGDFVSVI